MSDPEPLAAAFRAHWGRVVAALVRFSGSVDLAEDGAAEAFAAAARAWPRDGPPDDAVAWLTTVARRRVVDRVRRDRSLREATARLRPGFPADPGPVPGAVPDDRLELVFMCCHPALSLEARVALTLRAVCGLSTAEIARAFLVSEETMKRRLTRARTKVAGAVVPFAVPGPADLPARVRAVGAVLYLVFTQGYGDGRIDLAAEAVTLTRILVGLLPDQPEIEALLALMLLHDSRRDARFDGEDLVPLAAQDRRRWDRPRIVEARTLLAGALAAGADGPYALQAAIAEQQTHDPIDWTAVATLYARLARLTGSPVVELNRAVAVAETEGPAAALALVDGLDLDGYRYTHVVRAELLRRLDRLDEAGRAYGRALDLAVTEPERRHLRRRRDELDPGPGA